MNHPNTEIAVAYGDGIGPEIMKASLQVLEAAGADLHIHEVAIGKAVYEKGFSAGIDPADWATLRRTGVFYKAPITTPQGGGFKSLNVTVRKTLGLYANVRPCMAYAPYVATHHPAMDLVIVRENEEDLYAGIEHRQTEEVYQCLKLISRPGCERIVRYAFEYARAHGRRKVTCLTKDNIMKLTDGLFHKVFDEIAAEYPQIEREHFIVDIGAALLADRPEQFDVIVTSNLYGDIVSDIAAQVAGSVGLGGSANIGERFAMFEAIHGSALDLAGKDAANPSGLLLAGVMMLNHLGQPDVAELVHNAWLTTLEDGVHTGDMTSAHTQLRVGCSDFAGAVIDRLGREPKSLPARRYAASSPIRTTASAPSRRADKAVVGMDLFVEWQGSSEDLARKLKSIEAGSLDLKMITNRGVKVWPDGLPETLCTDHWRCRFMNEAPVSLPDLVALTGRAVEAGLDFIKAETLCTFDGEPGFSLGQGQ